MKMIGITCSIDEKRYFLNKDYIKKIVSLGFIPVIITPEMLVFRDFIVDKLSALIISGGGDIHPSFYGERNTGCRNIVPRERVEAEFELIKAFLPTRKPLLGICYGMQLINIYFGGSLIQDIQSPLNHKEGTHRVSMLLDFPIKKGEYLVNSSHHQAIKKLGEGLEVFCKAEDGFIEGVYLKEHPFFVGVQWHPERDNGEASKSLWQIFSKSIQ